MIKASIPKAKSSVDREMVLATIGNKVLPAFLENVFQEDPAWLDSAIDIGVFDLDKDLRVATADPSLQHVKNAVGALTAVLENVGCERVESDPQLGHIWGACRPLEALAYDGSPVLPELQNAFSRVVDAIVSSHDRLENTSNFGRSYAGLEGTLGVIYGRLMMCACILDCPDALKQLIQAYPDATAVALPAEHTRPMLTQDTDRLTTYGYALLLGRLDCMQVVEDAMAGKIPVVSYARGTDAGLQPLTALTMHERIQMDCLPGAYAAALRVAITNGGDPYPLVERAQQLLLVAGREEAFANMLPALMAVGLFDLNPATSFDNAVRGGRVQVLEHFEGRAPWSDSRFSDPTVKNPLMEALDAFTSVDKHPEFEASLLKVLEMAVKDGQQEIAFHVNAFHQRSEHGSRLVTYPLERLFEMDFVESLMKFLENGLDTEHAVVPGARTPIEIVSIEEEDRQENRATSVFRSFRARRAVDGLVRAQPCQIGASAL